MKSESICVISYANMSQESQVQEQAAKIPPVFELQPPLE